MNDQFNFTSAWPDGMANAVMHAIAEGMIKAIGEFGAEHQATEMAVGLLVFAFSKEFDSDQKVKIDYPFGESFAKTCAQELQRVDVGLVAAWRDQHEAAINFASTLGYCEMILFLERNKDDAVRALGDLEKLFVEKAFNHPPHG